jgi:acyl-CoA reductase-like NAD-dependent aldehyde dehydrogenase
VERCNALIDDTLAKGATLVCGGKAQNTLMSATVLDHVTPAMEIYREESFGPVKAAVRVNVPVLSAEPRRCPALQPTSQLVARSPA